MYSHYKILFYLLLMQFVIGCSGNQTVYRSDGEKVWVTNYYSEPSGADIYINEVYLGKTPISNTFPRNNYNMFAGAKDKFTVKAIYNNSIEQSLVSEMFTFYIKFNSYNNTAEIKSYIGDLGGLNPFASTRTIMFNKPSETIKADNKNIFPLPIKPLSKQNPITVNIISPKIDRGLIVIEKSYFINIVGNASGGSGIAKVLANGQQANLDEQGNFSAEILLKHGENQITISATDTQSMTSSKTFVVNRSVDKVVNSQTNEFKPIVASQTINKAKYHALIIAVQDYSSKEINKLDFPITDSLAIKDILTSRYSFDEKNIVFLKNPDRKTIGMIFNELRLKLSENDNLFIFYAGHGVWLDDMKQGFWLPRDASGANDPTDWISNNTIRDYIRSLKAKHILLVADACFSGSIFKVRDAFITPNASTEKIYEMPSRKAITSGSIKTVPDKSVFVEYLLKRLKDNQETFLDSQKLFVSFKEAVINNSPNNQTPLYGVINETGDEGGDFVFVKR